MATAEENLIAFKTTLDQHDVKYLEVDKSESSLGSNPPDLCIPINTELNQVQVFFWFNEDGESIHFGTGPLIRVPSDKMLQVFQAINTAHMDWRWVTFVITEQNDIAIRGDHLLSPDRVGDTCYDLLQRMLFVYGRAYGSFMRAIWGTD